MVFGEVSKGAAAGGEDDAFDFFALAGFHRLENGGVFGIDWEDGDVVFFRLGDEERAGDYEGFFVGQRELLAGADGGESGGEACCSYDRGEDHVDVVALDDFDECVFAAIDFCAEAFDFAAGGFVGVGGDRNGGGAVAFYLFYQFIEL